MISFWNQRKPLLEDSMLRRFSIRKLLQTLLKIMELEQSLPRKEKFCWIALRAVSKEQYRTTSLGRRCDHPTNVFLIPGMTTNLHHSLELSQLRICPSKPNMPAIRLKLKLRD